MLMTAKMMTKYSFNTKPKSDMISLKDQPRLILEKLMRLSSTESMTLLTDSNMVDMDSPLGITHWPTLMMAKMTKTFSEQ